MLFDRAKYYAIRYDRYISRSETVDGQLYLCTEELGNAMKWMNSFVLGPQLSNSSLWTDIYNWKSKFLYDFPPSHGGSYELNLVACKNLDVETR